MDQVRSPKLLRRWQSMDGDSWLRYEPVSILRRHPKKASPPEGSAAGLLFLVKYTDDTDLQNTIRQLKESHY
jgi:hypothetical protein